MQMRTLLLALGAAFILFVLRTAINRYNFNKRYKLPPRIPGWPIIGNTLDVPFPGGMWGVENANKYGEM